MEKPEEPRAYTTEEVREHFLNHVRNMVDYWDRHVERETTRERLSGLAFSLLVLLDGGTHLPGFVVAPAPHRDDREFHISEGKNYYPEAPEVECDIAGFLHELFYNGWQ